LLACSSGIDAKKRLLRDLLRLLKGFWLR
jgi:hypothetical protein